MKIRVRNEGHLPHIDIGTLAVRMVDGMGLEGDGQEWERLRQLPKGLKKGRPKKDGNLVEIISRMVGCVIKRKT